MNTFNTFLNNIGPKLDAALLSIPKPIWGTEQNLLEKLSRLYPKSIIQHTPKIIIHSKLYKPDYLIDGKIIVEFQGYQHYTRCIDVYKDGLRKEIFELNNYQFIEIPYFIQLNEDVTQKLFNQSIDLSNGFPCGFIHPKSGCFGDFCSAGLAKAKLILDFYSIDVKNQIFESLHNRSGVSGIPEKILNPFLL